MIKKCFLVLLTAALMLGNVRATQVTVNNVVYDLDDNSHTAAVRCHVNGKNATGTLTLMDTVEYNGTRYPVTRIKSMAFWENTQLTGNLVIPATVTVIESTAFWSCSGFNGTLTLSTGLTQLGNAAFRNCTGLTGSLVIPEGVRSIEQYAFGGCSGFNGTLTLASHLDSIGMYAFNGCSGLTGTLTVPEGVTEIKQCTFSNCSRFSGLVLPASLTDIRDEAFRSCTGLSGTLTLPDNLRTVGERAFWGCSGLTGNLVFGNKTTSIGEKAFERCSGLNGQLVLGRSVTWLGELAFGSTSFSSVKSLRFYAPQTNVIFISPYPSVVYIPCGAMTYTNTAGWMLNLVQMCDLSASPNALALGERPAGAWSRPFRFTLTNSGSSPINLLGAGIEGSIWDLVALDMGSYTLPLTIPAGDSITLGLSLANDYGAVSGSVHLLYVADGDTLDRYLSLSARLYIPAEGDVWEQADSIGTIVRNDRLTSSNLHSTYFLPGSNIPNGKNKVYKVVLTEDQLLSAYSLEDNAKFAVYAADFGGLGGPDESNCINPVRADGKIENLWLHPGTYYIVVSSTTSPYFTVSLHWAPLPDARKPTIISPADGATDVSPVGTTLRWSYGDYTTEGRLRLMAGDDPVQTPIDWTESMPTEYTIPDTLNYSTKYTWIASARNSSQTASSSTASFTTPILPPANLTSQEAGMLMTGETLHLTWDAPSSDHNAPVSLYKVYVKNQGETTFCYIGNASETDYERTGLEKEGTGDYSQAEYVVSAVYDWGNSQQGESAATTSHAVKVYAAAQAGGHVYQTDGTTPIAGAPLTFTFGTRTYVFTTDASGAWSGTLPVYSFDAGKVKVSASGYHDNLSTSAITIVAGTNTLDFSLEEIILGPFNVTVTAKPLAGGAVFGAGTYNNGDTCTLAVSSYRGYFLDYWTVNDSTVSHDSIYSFVVTEDANCVAHFDRFPYRITAKAEPAEYGTVEGAGTYKHFDAATLLATPNRGYQFVRWTLNGEEVSTTAMYSFLVTGPAEYVAHFELLNALPDVEGENEPHKFFRDGRLLILRAGILYDALGRKITTY